MKLKNNIKIKENGIKNNYKKLAIIIIINLLIFGLCNVISDIKYEEVDDFIIYSLYSGIDGTYNLHGIYVHPLICLIISIFYRIIPIINWHTIFLLAMQFICFTVMGYIILKKHDNPTSIILYTAFASAFYPALLMLIQYTSVAALIISTSLFICIDIIENNKTRKTKWLILIFALYTIGIMVRLQSLLIVVPFMALYLLIKIINCKNKKADKEKVFKLLKYYLVYLIITIIVYVSNIIIYNSNEVYKEYTKYNNVRTYLHDRIYVDYEENKEIFDEIGWSKNDWQLFYNFNNGDENIYSYENLNKILEYKIKKDGMTYLNTNISSIITYYISNIGSGYLIIFLIFFMNFIFALVMNKKNSTSILIFITTIAIHILFIIIKRRIYRVIIPEYILGTALLIYNMDIKKQQRIKEELKSLAISILTIYFLSICTISRYNYGHSVKSYNNYRELINYTNDNKENVYLYTVPSLQYRYLAYSVYQMPPKSSFSNLRVMGGWDMFTQNYYDFKEQNNLEGNFLDLLKDNVYLIDGDVYWGTKKYDNYKENIITAIKENYNIEVICEEIESFDNLKVYKLYEIKK